MSNRYDACKLLVHELWFVPDEAFDDEERRIDWDMIEEFQNKIFPSHTEELRVELASHLWSGSGATRLAELLDRSDPRTVVTVRRALMTYTEHEEGENDG